MQTISAYTGEGVMFAVDTRLRPNGREGALVQSEARLQELLRRPRRGLGRHHLHEVARAWPAMSTRATEFLNELQEVDWRRYGQSGRSRTELARDARSASNESRVRAIP